MSGSLLKTQALKLTELRYQLLPKLFRHLQSRDSLLGDVLYCHLFAEVLLEELIRLALCEHAEATLAVRLTFDQKLSLASKLKLAGTLELLPDYIVGSLRKLNSLRNRVAHTYQEDVTADDIRELFVGLEHELPYPDIGEHGERIALSRYAAFIFGHMLPKYELVEP